MTSRPPVGVLRSNSDPVRTAPALRYQQRASLLADNRVRKIVMVNSTIDNTGYLYGVALAFTERVRAPARDRRLRERRRLCAVVIDPNSDAGRPAASRDLVLGRGQEAQLVP
ncbi:hypothetical protein GCM10018771_20700 [Streptomyces cellulosae]|nr:hypothetical protein GCM10018771_20700 [Streptomyces cellulosae]